MPRINCKYLQINYDIEITHEETTRRFWNSIPLVLGLVFARLKWNEQAGFLPVRKRRRERYTPEGLETELESYPD